MINLNNFAISSRCKGEILENETVVVTKLLSYDIVSNPGFSNYTLTNLDELNRQIRIKELKQARIDKLNKLNYESQ